VTLRAAILKLTRFDLMKELSQYEVGYEVLGFQNIPSSYFVSGLEVNPAVERMASRGARSAVLIERKERRECFEKPRFMLQCAL
jgi:hypothetical protein